MWRTLALALALNELSAESGRLLDDTEAADNGDNEVVSGYLDLKRHNYLEAEATIGGLVQNRPNSPETVNLLAAAIYPQTRFGDAVLLLERAHELDPSLAWVEANLRRARAAKAAEALDISRKNLWEKMRKHGISDDCEAPSSRSRTT